MSSLFIARSAVLRSICRVIPLMLVGVLTTSAPVFAVDAPLTLAAAQHRAIERSRRLSAQDFAVDAAREMAIVARQLPDPILAAGIQNVPLAGADRFSLSNEPMTMRRIGVMQKITSADKRRLGSERYEHEAEKSLAEKEQATAAIERDTALAWLDRYYAEAMAAVIIEQRDQAKREIEAAEGAYRGGRGTRADILAARNALALIDDRASEIDRRLRNAKTMLARWIGDAADLPLAGKPDIDSIRFALPTLDSDALVTRLTNHPDVVILTRQEEIAATEAQLAKADKKADWSVEVAYQQRGPRYPDMISVGVSIPLQWNREHRQNRELAAKLATMEQVKDEREEMLRQRVADTRILINEWQNNRERHARYERELIPLAAERTAAVFAAYRGGQSKLADVLAAHRDEIDIRLQALQLEADTSRLWAQLDFLFPTTTTAAQMATPINESRQ